MRDSKMLTFGYKPFWMESDYVSNLFHVEPYALKYFKRRWYLLAKYGDSPLKIYALDRMQDIDIEFESFTMPEDFNAEAFFSSCFGIIVGEEKPQQIQLKVDDFQAKYLRSLPLHHSQKEVKQTEDYTVFSFYLRPTFDFIQELLALGETVEVLSPRHSRDARLCVSTNINPIVQCQTMLLLHKPVHSQSHICPYTWPLLLWPRCRTDLMWSVPV